MALDAEGEDFRQFDGRLAEVVAQGLEPLPRARVPELHPGVDAWIFGRIEQVAQDGG